VSAVLSLSIIFYLVINWIIRSLYVRQGWAVPAKSWSPPSANQAIQQQKHTHTTAIAFFAPWRVPVRHRPPFLCFFNSKLLGNLRLAAKTGGIHSIHSRLFKPRADTSDGLGK
jgi:hypothetical protein